MKTYPNMVVKICVSYKAVQIPDDISQWDTILAPVLGIPSFKDAGININPSRPKTLHLWDEFTYQPVEATPGDWILVRERDNGTKGIRVMNDENFKNLINASPDAKANSVLDA